MVLEPPLEEDERRTYTKTQQQAIRRAKAVLDAEIAKVDKALEQYSCAADSLDHDVSSIEEILQKVTSNVEAATTHWTGHMPLQLR
ncbi:unnamed protein product [Heligmosomoides polygyrus]|uniref:t-SNARE coiled-coil homology domain-containing protein n=1 Tax=Heligmosomoides polygyrus TaxID=6339 RepID=A0A183GI83_HELPZ|nr:unnamed protein product [Heligmosomoides polygyrus]